MKYTFVDLNTVVEAKTERKRSQIVQPKRILFVTSWKVHHEYFVVKSETWKQDQDSKWVIYDAKKKKKMTRASCAGRQFHLDFHS